MKFFERKFLPFVVLFFIVFISRLPFLSAGYGVEEDSWGIALAGFHTKMSGVYEPSRFPGHPVHELIYSVFWGFKPFFYNAFNALFSAIATLFFALILKELKFNYFFIAALAFAFTPVLYISSTYTIDFAWTIAFVLISFYALLKNQFVICGIFLGLAVGCRITSGALLLPFMIILWEQNNFKENIIKLIKIIFSLFIVAFISFLPLIREFGFSFFMYYDQFPYPSFAKVFYKMIPGVFGLVGFIGIGIALIYIFIKKNELIKGSLFENHLNKKIIIASSVILILFSISYFRLPQKSGYMITVIPFTILLFGYYLNERMFKLLCFSLILSPFICSINLTDKIRGAGYSKYSYIFNVSGQELFFDPFSGPVFSDYSKRLQKMNYTDEVIKKTESISSKTVVIAGWWYNELLVTLIPRKSNELVKFEFYIDAEKMNQYLSQGFSICYLPEQNIYNDQMFKMNLTDKMATAF